MNKIAAAIAVGVGGVFFALETLFPYNPVFGLFDTAVDYVFSPDHAKARAAVSKRLANPSSAEFEGLRTVELTKLKYVCGGVSSKDKTGISTGRRSFVYDMVSDYALLETDVSSIGADTRFKPCLMTLADGKAPVSAKPKPEEKPKTEVSNKESILAKLPVIPAAAKPEAELRKVLPKGESEAAPANMQANLQALSDTTTARTKWISFMTGQTSLRPTADSDKALNGLLGVDPQSKDYPQAWNSAVELRKNDLDTAPQRQPQTFTEDFQEIHRRVSTAAKKCVASKIGLYASMSVDGELRGEAGYGETVVWLVSKDQRNFHLSARVDKVQTGAKLSVRSGSTLGGDDLAKSVVRWAGGDTSC